MSVKLLIVLKVWSVHVCLHLCDVYVLCQSVFYEIGFVVAYRGLVILWHSWPVTGFEHTFLKIASATAIPTTQGKKQSRT